MTAHVSLLIRFNYVWFKKVTFNLNIKLFYVLFSRFY